MAKSKAKTEATQTVYVVMFEGAEVARFDKRIDAQDHAERAEFGGMAEVVEQEA